MNREQLRLKLWEAYATGRTRLNRPDDLENSHSVDWGFCTLVTDKNFEAFFGITDAEFYSDEFDAIGREVAEEIKNSPLYKALL